MPDLKDVFTTLEQKHPKSNIAGCFNGDDFYYEVSSSQNLPAAVFFFDSPKLNDSNVFTNLPANHWLYTYTEKSRGSRMVRVNSAGGPMNLAVKQAVLAKTRSISVVAGAGGEGPLGKAGGLYQAAQNLIKSTAPVSYKAAKPEDKIHTEEKGLHRALRYYMLAAYSLLGKGVAADYRGGNYICALLVDDTGKILSWGLNSGFFHHGEVNMLLNYFGNNPTATTIPAKSLVFSTLTPCEQCSSYLQAVRPAMTSAERNIFMGQKDDGPKGKAGEAYGKYLRDLTDPVRVVSNKGLANNVSPYNIDSALSGQIDGRGGTVASRIGQWCQLELGGSRDTLLRKHGKTRTPDLLDQKVKIGVLTYLSGWLDSVKLNESSKIIP